MNSRPIYVSTSCLPGIQSAETRLKSYRGNGLNHIELGAGVWVNDNDLSRLTDSEGELLIHNYFPPPEKAFVLNLASSNPVIRKRSVEFALTAIDLCSDLKAPFYSVHAGFVTDPVGIGATSFLLPTPGSPDEENKAMDRFISSLELCIAHAKRLGLKLLVENNVCSVDHRGKLLLQTGEEIMTLFHALPSPVLGILLDTGHLNVSACTCGFERSQFIEKIGGFVRAFHINDNGGYEDTHDPISTDSWVLEVLRKDEFAGLPVIVEARFERVEDLCSHVDWLRTEVS